MCRLNRLQLNPEKTELLWCTTSRRQHRLPTATLSVGSTTVAPVSSVHDLGIFVDSDLVMRSHVCRTVSSCFAALRQLRSIRHLVSATVFQSLVAALVLCRLDYGNGTLVGLPCPPTPVGPERCGATGIPSPPILPHHGCAGQPPPVSYTHLTLPTILRV